MQLLGADSLAPVAGLQRLLLLRPPVPAMPGSKALLKDSLQPSP